MSKNALAELLGPSRSVFDYTHDGGAEYLVASGQDYGPFAFVAHDVDHYFKVSGPGSFSDFCEHVRPIGPMYKDVAVAIAEHLFISIVAADGKRVLTDEEYLATQGGSGPDTERNS
jgi:hypothetical protein